MDGSCALTWMLNALPTVPAWSAIFSITGAVVSASFEILSANVASDELPSASVTVTVTVWSPSAVGVPEMRPVFASTVTPAGRPVAE